MEKQCPVCNKVFISWNSLKIYCSESCRKKNWKDKNKKQVREYENARARRLVREEREKNKKVLVCPNCGKEFVNTSKKNYTLVRFCSSRCRGLYNDRLSKEKERESEPMRKCVICKEMFDPRESYYYKTVKTCSPSCSKKLWREKHKHDKSYKKYKALRQRNRKHRIRANGGNVTNGEWEEIRREFDYKCAICGKGEPFDQSCTTLTQDHIKPISKGGKHTRDNLQPLCMECNIRKYNN